MNRQNTSRQTAGREMDALLAEKVMGYTLSDLSLLAYPKYKLFDIESGEFSGYLKEVPHYSTDIAAAWEVVEKMGNYLFACGRNDEGMWEACFFPVNSGIGKLSEAHGDTAPLAISRAALKATGVNIYGDS
jgi:hypothetical protein